MSSFSKSGARPLLWMSLVLAALIGTPSYAESGQPLNAICPRPPTGTTVVNPPELSSHNGLLEVTFHLKFQQTLVGEGPPRYCFITEDGLESPTLRVRPGDELIIHLHNDLAQWTPDPFGRQPTVANSKEGNCDGTAMDASTTNLHFHGMTVPPTCHQDDVIHTAISSGQEFEYRVKIPSDEPPGLYWYHPHPHGYSERQVQGGGSGAIIVEGLKNSATSYASLPQRILVLRDQPRVVSETPGPLIPAWDISLNFVPVIYPDYVPAIIEAGAGEKELWRVVNAGADTIFNLQVLINRVAQPLTIVAIDGVPVRSRPDPPTTGILLPPGGRAEFVLTTPMEGEEAQVITEAWDTGPSGDVDPKRPIANIVASPHLDRGNQLTGLKTRLLPSRYTSRLRTSSVVQRRLYFSQLSTISPDADVSVFYFITVLGQTPKTYSMTDPPNIVVHQGAVEDWTIENRSPEDHVFHMHQLHFQVLAVDGKAIDDLTMRDTVDLPYWSGEGPYPSVKLRMNFGDPNVVGTFLYHCHILKHEDIGMMGAIEVLPPGMATALKLSGPTRPQPATLLHFAAQLSSRNPGHKPTGGVQFAIDGINAGTPITLSDGRAEFTTSFDDSGLHVLTATYSGDAVYDESVAPALKVAVGP